MAAGRTPTMVTTTSLSRCRRACPRRFIGPLMASVSGSLYLRGSRKTPLLRNFDGAGASQMTTRWGARLEGMLRDRQMKMKLTTLLLLCAAPSWSFAPAAAARAARARGVARSPRPDETAEPAPSAEEILEYREDMARRRELLDGFFRRMMLSPETLAPADVERVVDECRLHAVRVSVGGVEYGPDDDHFAAKALSLARVRRRHGRRAPLLGARRRRGRGGLRARARRSRRRVSRA